MKALLQLYCVIAIASTANSASFSGLEWLTEYINWTVIPNTADFNSINGLEIPLNIEITSDTSEDHCVPSKGPYCYHSNHTSPSGKDGNCAGGAEARCDQIVCADMTEDWSDSASTNFPFLNPATMQPAASNTGCGLSVNSDSLEFGEHLSNENGTLCNASDNSFLPVTVLNTELQSYTASFSFFPYLELLLDDPVLFLSISMKSFVGDFAGSVLIYVDKEGAFNTTITGGGQIKHYKPLDVGTRSFTIVASYRGFALFFDGEIAMTKGVSSDGSLSDISIKFGSYGFRGEIRDVKVYNQSASTSEVYALFSGEPFARHLLEPQCHCPRIYGDSFNLLYAQNYRNKQDYLCQPTYGSASYKPRFRGISRSKWSIFNNVGWISDFTNQARVQIKMRQSMLTYAVSGRFPWPIKRPKSMEVRIHSANGVVVYVSDNCQTEYGVNQTMLPKFEYNQQFYRKKRQTQKAVADKCYSWNDVATSSQDIEIGLLYNWFVPVIGPNEVDEYLSDSFMGDVSIVFKGQQLGGDEKNTNWYHVSHLKLYSQPHCGGHGSQLVGEPTTMSEYYNFFKPGTKAYECECPDGIQGDRCESCADVDGLYRYKKGPNECADCACSDLARSAQCDRETGQCDCQADVDDQLAGRQCYWYISEVSPQYGPVAGGTRIIVEGGNFVGDGIAFEVFIGETLIHEKNATETKKNIIFLTPPSTFKDSWVICRVNALGGNIGPPARFFDFEYRPNPIVVDLDSRTTILSGGTLLEVIGKYLDSVATPFMTVFVRQNGKIAERIKTECSVISGTLMSCPVGNLRPIALPLLLGAQEVTSPANGDTTTSTAVVETTPPVLTTPTVPQLDTTSQDFTTPVGGVPFRRRREVFRKARGISSEQPNENFLNGIRNVEFSIGFVFDGLDAYRDLTKSSDPNLRDLSKLYVYDDPEFTKYEQVLEYHPDDITIKIYGKRLDYSLSDDDYKVTIGLNGYCTITSLQTNQLVCQPPEKQPEVDLTNSENHNDKTIPHIQVEYAGEKFVVGYIYYKTNFWNDNLAARIGISVAVAVLCLIIIIVVIYFVVRKYRNKTQLRKDAEQNREASTRYIKSPGHEEAKIFFPGKKLDPNIHANVERCRIPAERLKLGKQLGKGNFGAVFKGQLITPSGNLKTVAVKTIKEDKEMSFDDMENFLAEGTLMIDFKHENVLSLIGVVSEDAERPLVVLPYMENGDLCTFLKKDDLMLVLADLLHFGLQIANGMAYLAKERFVHRDLAARNCMVDGSYIVKIADFGMSRDVYEKDYYTMENMNKPLPMKWMAVESLKEGRFSSMSDVWAYGITMWELLTRGNTPYPGVNNYYIKEYVSTGRRLDKPSICPPIIYELMCTCWEEVPEERPTFPQIADYIKKLLNGSQAPAAGSDAAAGYDYTRSATRNIPEDYLDFESMPEPDDYITPLADPEPQPLQKPLITHAASNDYLN